MIYGLLAELDSPEDLLAAARRVREEGYRDVDAYTPFPIEEVSQALGYHGSRMPIIVFLGGVAGLLTGYGLQRYSAVVDYPLNVGGRPTHSWPMFIPVTFELTVLTAALAAFLAVFVLCRLPRFHHPLFAAPLFGRATDDGFYLCVSADDPKFDPAGTREMLHDLRATEIEEVAR